MQEGIVMETGCIALRSMPNGSDMSSCLYNYHRQRLCRRFRLAEFAFGFSDVGFQMLRGGIQLGPVLERFIEFCVESLIINMDVYMYVQELYLQDVS